LRLKYRRSWGWGECHKRIKITIMRGKKRDHVILEKAKIGERGGAGEAFANLSGARCPERKRKECESTGAEREVGPPPKGV